jgi:hypothetical protein
MRAHGVTNFPDQAGGGINLAGTGINPQSPAFRSARVACAKFTPGSIQPPQATAAQFRAAINFAKCIRTHGYASFPDPSRTDGPPAPVLVIAAGLFFHVSSTFNPNTAAFNHAAAICQK